MCRAYRMSHTKMNLTNLQKILRKNKLKNRIFEDINKKVKLPAKKKNLWLKSSQKVWLNSSISSQELKCRSNISNIQDPGEHQSKSPGKISSESDTACLKIFSLTYPFLRRHWRMPHQNQENKNKKTLGRERPKEQRI